MDEVAGAQFFNSSGACRNIPHLAFKELELTRRLMVHTTGNAIDDQAPIGSRTQASSTRFLSQYPMQATSGWYVFRVAGKSGTLNQRYTPSARRNGIRVIWLPGSYEVSRSAREKGHRRTMSEVVHPYSLRPHAK